MYIHYIFMRSGLNDKYLKFLFHVLFQGVSFGKWLYVEYYLNKNILSPLSFKVKL